MFGNQNNHIAVGKTPDAIESIRPPRLRSNATAVALTLSLAWQAAPSEAAPDKIRIGDRDPVVWLKQIEGTKSTLCTGIVPTASGPIIIGQFVGSVKGGDRVSAASHGGNDGFVASYSTEGMVRWITPLGGMSDDGLRAIAADTQGNVYVSGFVSGTELGSSNDAKPASESKSDADAVLVKFSPKGKQLWSRRVSGVNADQGSAVTVAADGVVFWGGQFQKSASMQGFSDLGMLESAGGSDAFVAAFDAAGQPRWLKSFGGKQNEIVSSLVSDGVGGVILAGTYEGILPIRLAEKLDLLRAVGGKDIVMARLDSNGDIQWARSLSGKQQEYPVALRNDGNRVWLSGNFQDQLQLDATTSLHNKGVFDGFVSTWSMDGKLAWAKRFGGSNSESVQGMSMSADGSMNVAGSFLGGFDFGEGTSQLKTDELRPFISRIDSNGRWVNAFALDSKDSADVFGVASAPDGDVYVCGVAEGELDLGGHAEVDDDNRDSGRNNAGHRIDSDPQDRSADEHKKKKKKRSTAFIARIHSNPER